MNAFEAVNRIKKYAINQADICSKKKDEIVDRHSLDIFSLNGKEIAYLDMVLTCNTVLEDMENGIR